MNITIKTHGTSLTPSITDYINKRIGTISKFIAQKEADATASVRVNKTSEHHHAGANVFATEVNLDAGGFHIRAEAFDADLYASIDKVKDEMIRELNTKKQKKQTLLRKGGQKLKNMIRGFYSSSSESSEK